MTLSRVSGLVGVALIASSTAMAGQGGVIRPRSALSARSSTAGETQVSPCGRHTLRVAAGTIFVDGRRVHGPGERVRVVAVPVWRRDGRAVAWVETTPVGSRLAVLVDVARPDAPMFWALPTSATNDHLAWAGPHRIVMGNNILSPRAIASWTEDQK